MKEIQSVIIEDQLQQIPVALRLTVVRTKEKGCIISTIQSPSYSNSPDFETKLWEFDGYEHRKGNNIPIVNFGKAIEKSRLDNPEHSFEGNPDAAIEYHYQVVETIAQALENGEFGWAQEGSNL